MLDREISYPAPSAEEYQATMRAHGMSEGEISVMINLYAGSVAQGWAATIAPDTATLLGRSPLTFEQYARDYADHWR